MKSKIKIITYLPLVLLPIAVLLSYLGSLNPSLVEHSYSRNFFKPLGQGLSSLTGVYPFSLAELIIITTAALILIKIATLIKKGEVRRLLPLLGKIIIAFCILYFAFIIVWGLNYHRLPFSEIAHLDTRPASVQELTALCQKLIDRGNNLRQQVKENEEGVFSIPGGHSTVFVRAAMGYEIAARTYPQLGGSFGRPKGVLFSHYMSYTGITGVYFPFTGEANVNTSIPHVMLPATTAHEMAHQRGFAREDEANYIAYLTCTLHPDKDFQYSGVFLALLHAMDALYTHAPEQYKALVKTYSPSLKRDLSAYSKHWQKYEGVVERISTEINNAYLKSNLQEDGVFSYGRMVDLLIAEHRKNK